MHSFSEIESLPKLYCGSCGRKLKPRNKIMGYNEYTGEPLVNYSFACPGPYCIMNPDRKREGW